MLEHPEWKNVPALPSVDGNMQTELFVVLLCVGPLFASHSDCF